MSVLILEPSAYSEVAIKSYEALGSVAFGNPVQHENPDVQVLVVRLGYTLNEEFLAQFPALSVIVSPTTGLTHIDMDVCASRNIRIFSLADCRSAIEEVTSTSELTLGLMIALLRSVVRANKDVVENSAWDRDRFRSRQLSRLTLGIIGLGRIGGHVAGYAHALGMKVLAHDPEQSSSRFEDKKVQRCSLDSLLMEADIITLHASLNAENSGLINQAAIEKMRNGVLLVNTARGALLDESAVVAGLESGKVAGVAVDVLASEHSTQTVAQSPLVQAAVKGHNVIITPHIGGCTSDAMHITEERLADVVVNALLGVSK